jgi:hypothetical protein
MKRLVKFLTAITLLLNVPLTAQITIGQYTLARIAAPTLRASIGAGGFTGAFLGSVGGVAFKEAAQPVPGFSAQSIVLEYAPQYPDGRRVSAIVDGQPVQVNLYDWQLRPIVRFAQSNEHAVFTLFGRLTDQRQQAEVLDNGGRVVNYHPAFENTLLGLRMLQVDNLVASSKGNDLAVDLPREHNCYLLGPGEPSPDIANNRAALARYRNAVKASLAEDAADFRSYVIGDSGREVRFDVERGSLEISGQPGYYFWRYNGDDPAVQQRVLSSVRTRIRLAKNTARQSQGAGFNENSWLAAQVVEALRHIDGEPASPWMALTLQSWDTKRLNDALENARLEQAMTQPAYRKIQPRSELSQFVNARIELVRSINPIVWDAATTVMRYSAFFRYCKENNPSAWQDFVARVGAIQIRPSVMTPTVLQLASATGSDRSPFRQ